MKLVDDNPSCDILCDHDLVRHSRLKKILAFLIVGASVDTVPGLRLVHGNRIHEHACYDVDNRVVKFTIIPWHTASIHNPSVFRVAVKNINNLVSTAATTNLQPASGYFSFIE